MAEEKIRKSELNLIGHLLQPHVCSRKSSYRISDRCLSNLCSMIPGEESTTSLGKLFHCHTALTIRNFFLDIYTQNLSWSFLQFEIMTIFSRYMRFWPPFSSAASAETWLCSLVVERCSVKWCLREGAERMACGVTIYNGVVVVKDFPSGWWALCLTPMYRSINAGRL